METAVTAEFIRLAIPVTVESNGRVIEADPRKEYIAGGQWVPLYGGYGSMAAHILRVTEAGGPGLADLMMTDEAVAGAVLSIAQAVLAQGMQITATVELDDQEEVEDLTAEDVDLAFQIEDHCQRCWKALPDPHGLLWRLLQGAMRYRTMLGEVVKDLAGAGPDEGLYILDRVSVKEPLSWSFNLDPFGNVRGIHAHIASAVGRITTSEMLNREKFVILAWDPIKGNPWGQGILQRAYNDWNFKVQLYPLLWKYAQLFAIPQTVVTASDKAQARQLLDDQGVEYGDKVPPEVWLFKAFEKMKQGGSLVAVPHGTEVKTDSPSGNGAVFQLIFDILNRGITRGIQQMSRSSPGNKRSNGTDAAAEIDMMSLPVNYGKQALASCLTRDLWRVHVVQNFGEEIARKFTPSVSFGMTESENFSRNANAVAKLYSVGLLQEQHQRDALKFLSLNFGRRRKSQPSADLRTEPAPGTRPVNVRKGQAA
jgi:hypothetical protein